MTPLEGLYLFLHLLELASLAAAFYFIGSNGEAGRQLCDLCEREFKRLAKDLEDQRP